ncbi:MAG: adenylate/guanylate cyclase domain-containing protein [Actinomycetota bacterium]
MSDPGSLAGLDKQNRSLARKLERLQTNMRQLEEIRDTNSTLLANLMHELDEERSRSKELLLNILPRQIVDRLEAGETQIADRFDSVSVLMSDLVGFTSISARLDPKILVSELNRLFSEFDEICARCGMEKIKTIGDAYMAVGGLPGTREDHVVAAAEMGLSMIEALERVNREGDVGWQIRIGLHTGPAVAGVIGTWKFVYDVWGDTVNMASRLESTSLPGRVHISQDVADSLGTAFEVAPRGVVDLKGKGRTETSFLEGRAT